MSITTALGQLDTLSWDQLAIAYRILNTRALDARTSTGRTRAMNARERVADEVSRRGLVIRSNRHNSISLPEAEVVYMVGRLADFTPIGR